MSEPAQNWGRATSASPPLTTKMHQAELLSESDRQQALEILDTIQGPVEESGSRLVQQRYRMTRILVAHMAGVNRSPDTDTSMIDFGLCRTNLGSDYALRKLVKLGLVAWPEQVT